MLNIHFLNSLFRIVFSDKEVARLINEHLLYSYIPEELVSFKQILRYIKNCIAKEEIPLKEICYQHFSEKESVLDCLDGIFNEKIPSKAEILKSFEEFIKHSLFKKAFNDCIELWEDNKKNQSLSNFISEAELLSRFSLFKSTNCFQKVFEGFEKRIDELYTYSIDTTVKEREKIPFCIPCLDEMTGGGIDCEDTTLLLMRSGVGKSTQLRYHSFQACRLGFKVLHIQAEGSKRECVSKYDQMWLGVDYTDLMSGKWREREEANSGLKKFIDLSKRMVNSQKEVTVYGFEKFGEASMFEVRNLILEYEKQKGFFPDLIVIDYLDLFDVGDGLKYGSDPYSQKMKRTHVARKMKNLCLEFKTRIITATQTSDVPMSIWNDSEKVITRNFINADKNLCDSFSYIFSGNQTDKENENNILRIYIDKLRNYKRTIKTIPIYTDYESGRFCNFKKSIELSKELGLLESIK